MGFCQEGSDSELHDNESAGQDGGALCLHAFSDLTHIPPVVFLHLLQECYIHGQCKATKKFQALQYQVHQVLRNNPQPGPATFVVQCLFVLPIFGLYSEGFSHLIISSFRRFLKSETTLTSQSDTLKAEKLAALLFLNILGGSVGYDEKVLVKILEVFDVKLSSIDEAIGQLKPHNGCGFENAKVFLEHYIFSLIESRSYLTAVSLLEHFSMPLHQQSFLQQMVQNKEFAAAEKWATFMGKPSLCALVQEYGERNLLKNALTIINKNNLRQEFPELYHKCKESSLKNLAEKACWDVAEAKANGDRRLLEYLVYLAMEAAYSEKVDELCDRYALEGFVKAKEAEVGLFQNQYLHLDELAAEDIIWVDEVDGLRTATCYLDGCKFVGIDCEWKPNYIKGSKPNKVSIMQMASDGKVFILDLIRLSKEVPDILDNCLSQILQSPRILKLSYNFQCDVRQLAQSYGEMKCFRHYDMLLDLQNVFKEESGGLSGLAKKVLGAGLNKTRRNSNWEQRPLSQQQLEYAALDAAVLIQIFFHVRDRGQLQNISEGQKNPKWKSHIVSHMDNLAKKSKKKHREK